MNLQDTAIAAARPDVIDEVFDGEAVLVHLRTGLYYALNARASALWSMLNVGRTPAAVADAVAAAEGRDPDVVRVELAAFATQLRAEELVIDAPPQALPAPVVDAPLPPGIPELQRYSDMQDLLMLDPIHDLDLDRDGWPVGRDGVRVEPAA